VSLRVAVLVFPGSNCEQDVLLAFGCLGVRAEYVWHHATDLGGFDASSSPAAFPTGTTCAPVPSPPSRRSWVR
jgi:phosphoribosylformylglycinamidine (FGAM) synthase-like amidotransferase family enzyme